MNPLLKLLLWGISAAILSGSICMFYNRMHQEASATDYTEVLNVYGMYGASMIGCVLAALGYWILTLISSKWVDIIHNSIFLAISMASFYPVFSFTFPEGSELDPALFLSLAAPMHFVPMLAWLMLKPLFEHNKATN
jgi:hypothetical protein